MADKEKSTLTEAIKQIDKAVVDLSLMQQKRWAILKELLKEK